jgi:hypothetical protein
MSWPAFLKATRCTAAGASTWRPAEVWPAPAVDYAREIGHEDEYESDDLEKYLELPRDVASTGTEAAAVIRRAALTESWGRSPQPAQCGITDCP